MPKIKITIAPGSISKFSSLIVIVTSLVILIGWLMAPVPMIRNFPTLARLSPTSAAILILIAFSFRLSQFERINPWARRVSKAFRITVGLLGLIGLSEAAFNWDLGLKLLLFRGEQTVTGIQPWLHTSAVTVLCFYLLACSLILLNSRHGYWACQILTIGVIVVLFGAFVQRLYGIRPFTHHLEIEVVASVLLLILAIGILDSNRHRGLMAVVSSPDEGGLMARRLLPASIVIPVVLGWIRFWGERSGRFGPDAGLILHVLATVVVLAVFIWWNAAALNRSAGRRLRSERAILEVQSSYQRLLENSSDAFCDLNLDGEFTSLNKAAKELLGHLSDETVGLSIFGIVDPESHHIVRNLLSSALLGGPGGPEPVLIRSGTGELIRADAHVAATMRDSNPQGYMVLLRRRQEPDDNALHLSAVVAIADMGA